ncbi:MAG: hypothetical protein H7Z74_14715 [Anaerolineae bacterium]|nr:hypothetical protein [Gemmatimonadaceae bacterium]
MTDNTVANVDESRLVMSVVVTIVDGGDVLRRFLDALVGQVDAPSMEILVPYDSSIPETADLIRHYPQLHLIDMGKVETIRPITTAAGQHELYDRRRAAGLGVARGKLWAILEDRAPPRSDWVRNMVRLHEQPYGAIGGAIECAPGDLLNWAFYACDFSRYALPFVSGPRQWISDVNICYKRAVIESTREIWKERFNEAKVHWTLLERGETLFLSSDVIVDYKTPYSSLGAVLPERFHWGRLFGHVRAKHVSALRRLLFVLSGPLIPLRLLVRHGLVQRQKGNFRRFVKASPLMLTLLTAWTTGEVWGYITNRP